MLIGGYRVEGGVYLSSPPSAEPVPGGHAVRESVGDRPCESARDSICFRKGAGSSVGGFRGLRLGYAEIIPMVGTFGGVIAFLCKIQRLIGREPFLKLHSFRAFIPTCAEQLQFGMEKRRKLGRWSATSTIPDRYDRAAGAPELATRNKMSGSFAEGWRQSKEFGIPTSGGTLGRRGKDGGCGFRRFGNFLNFLHA